MRSPADSQYYEPPSLLTRKGFAEAIGMVRRRVTSRFAPAFLDLSFVAILWVLVTYVYAWLMWKEFQYLLVPGWLFALGIIEATALWQSFGRSLGLRVVSKRLVSGEGGVAVPTFRQRLIYYLMFHISVIPLIGLVWRVPWHERLSGLTASQVSLGAEKPAPWYRTTSGIFVAILIAALLIGTFAVTIEKGTWTRFLRNPSKAGRIFRALLSPDFQFWKNALFGLFETIYMGIMATLIGVLIAAPLSFVAARNLMKAPLARLLYMVIRGFLSFIRSIQPIVWAIIFLVWVGPSRTPFAGFLALLVHSVADLTKLYSERLESIETGPVEAITATGGNWLSVLRYAVIPQIINPYLSFTLYRWDINIRMATIVGLVGGGGIGQLLILLLRAQRFNDAAVCIILIALVVWGIDTLSSRLRAYYEQGRLPAIEEVEESSPSSKTQAAEG